MQTSLQSVCNSLRALLPREQPDRFRATVARFRETGGQSGRRKDDRHERATPCRCPEYDRLKFVGARFDARNYSLASQLPFPQGASRVASPCASTSAVQPASRESPLPPLLDRNTTLWLDLAVRHSTAHPRRRSPPQRTPLRSPRRTALASRLSGGVLIRVALRSPSLRCRAPSSSTAAVVTPTSESLRSPRRPPSARRLNVAPNCHPDFFGVSPSSASPPARAVGLATRTDPLVIPQPHLADAAPCTKHLAFPILRPFLALLPLRPLLLPHRPLWLSRPRDGNVPGP